MPEPITSLATAATGAVFAALSESTQRFILTEAARLSPAFEGRVRTAWRALRGTYERDRLVRLGEEWPPQQCLSVRAVQAAHDHIPATSVRVTGEHAKLAFRLSVLNVAPFRVTLRQHEVRWSVWIANRDRAHDTCDWKGPVTLPGHTDILPGKELVL